MRGYARDGRIRSREADISWVAVRGNLDELGGEGGGVC
jgi:hypothetical protein